MTELGEIKQYLIKLLTDLDEVNLLICGSRDISAPWCIYDFLLPLLSDPELKRLHIKEKLYIVQGEARGVDLLAKFVAIRLGLKTKDFPADWDTHGRRAGFLRNQAMVDIAHMTLACWDGVSKGTLHSINISKKKGIPVMVIDNILPTNMSTEEIVAYLVKKQAISSLIFELGVDTQPLIEEIEKLEGFDVEEGICELVKQFGHRPMGFNDLPISYVTDKLLEANYRGYIVRIAHAKVSRLRDLLIPKQVHRLYIKLETGGLAGWQRSIGKRGEETYPILRLTMRVNEMEALDVFIKPAADAILDPKTMEYHKSSGLMHLVEEKGVPLSEAINQVRMYLTKHGVKNTNPVSNIHTHLVGFNAEFNRAFLSKQIPPITLLASPKDISIDKLVAIYDIEGNYESIPLPQLYKSDPLAYIESMHQALRSLGRPITIERIPF